MMLIPFQDYHFPLMRKWLNKPHLQATFGEHLVWTDEMVKKKYTRQMDAFIIQAEGLAIGYVQFYDAFAYPRDNYDLKIALQGTAYALQKLAAIDIFIGEEEFLSRGFGSLAIHELLEHHIFPTFDAALVDPDKNNKRAIRAYTKTGFTRLKECNGSLLMVNLPSFLRREG